MGAFEVYGDPEDGDTMILLPSMALRKMLRNAFLAGASIKEGESREQLADDYEYTMANGKIVLSQMRPMSRLVGVRPLFEQPTPLQPGTVRSRFVEPMPSQHSLVEHFMSTVRGAIRIPAGTKPRNCAGPNCGQIIYDVPKRGGLREPEHVNATEKKVSTSPVSIAKYKDNPIGIPPTDTEDGAGINHFADCPDAQRFHKSR